MNDELNNQTPGQVHPEGMFMTIEQADEILLRKAMICKTSFSSKTAKEISDASKKGYNND